MDQFELDCLRDLGGGISVSLGCVFTQTTWNRQGYAIRDPDSTTDVATIEPAEEFGKRICLEARLEPGEKKATMGDGAE